MTVNKETKAAPLSEQQIAGFRVIATATCLRGKVSVEQWRSDLASFLATIEARDAEIKILAGTITARDLTISILKPVFDRVNERVENVTTPGDPSSWSSAMLAKALRDYAGSGYGGNLMREAAERLERGCDLCKDHRLCPQCSGGAK